MKTAKQLIARLHYNAARDEITVLTAAEANAVYKYIDELEARIEAKQEKFIAICEQTYQMVKVNRELRKQLENSDGQTAQES